MIVMPVDIDVPAFGKFRVFADDEDRFAGRLFFVGHGANVLKRNFGDEEAVGIVVILAAKDRDDTILDGDGCPVRVADIIILDDRSGFFFAESTPWQR